MLKKVVALSTAAMLLLTPMGASAVTWGEVVNGLRTSNTFKQDGLTATKDGDSYTFTGGKIEGNVAVNPFRFGVNGKFYFNGVQFESMDIYTNEGKCYIVLDKDTKAGSVYTFAEKNGQIELVNKGTIGTDEDINVSLEGNSHLINEGTIGTDEFASIFLYGGSSHLTNRGTLKAGEGTFWPTQNDDEHYESIPNVAGYAIADVESGTQAEAEKLVDRMYTFDTPGTYTIIVTLDWEDEDGGHTKSFIVTRTVAAEAEDEGPSEEEIRHDMEMKRQAEAVGGVTGSPYWIKQMYLGYHSYNLRLAIDGEPVVMRERLSWNADKTKAISLRVNTVSPEKLTMRFDENVLEVFERTNITVVTLVDKNGAAVMQYNVADLRAAYDQYGLSGKDMLVVGGADDDVMKIGEDGQLVPVE